jgi:hypothetical protein
VEHQRVIALQQQRKKGGETVGIVVHEGMVGVLHQAHGFLGGEMAPRRLQVLHGLHHGRIDRQRMHGHPWHGAHLFGTLLRPAEIGHA